MKPQKNIKLEKKLGEGSFGIVYRVLYNNTKYALKIEKIKGSIEEEIKILRVFNHPSIPKILNCGCYNGFSFMIIPLYKISLAQALFNQSGFLNSKSVAVIGCNLLDIFEYIHNNRIVYRDIKPENIMVGFDGKIYLIDFGLCAPIVNCNAKSNIKLVGTIRYASINAHNGMNLSERDDLESLAYVLIYLIRKNLPWLNLEDRDDVKIIKQKSSTDELCSKIEHKNMWRSFVEYIKAKDRFIPIDYEFLRSVLIRIIKSKANPHRCTLFERFLICSRPCE